MKTKDVYEMLKKEFGKRTALRFLTIMVAKGYHPDNLGKEETVNG